LRETLLFQTEILWELEYKEQSWLRESWITLPQCLVGEIAKKGGKGEGEGQM
jgi:hypothetical protein